MPIDNFGKSSCGRTQELSKFFPIIGASRGHLCDSSAFSAADLYCLLYTGKIGILFVTESWLHSGIPDGLLDPRGKYSIIRRDRPTHRGGGVCIMIENQTVNDGVAHSNI